MAGRLAAGLGLAIACLLGGMLSSTAREVHHPRPLLGRVVPDTGRAVQGRLESANDYPCFGREVTMSATNDDDEIRGTSDDDVINGLRGDDSIWGLGGDDVICAGLGDDRVHGNPGRDWVRGGPGADKAHGGDDTDSIFVLDYELGNDVADGGQGGFDACSVDVALASQSRDEYTGECEDVVASAPAPDHPCFGREVTIVATNYDDEILGTPGDDVINALRGDDRVLGLGGEDRICGGRGDDNVNGNWGGDWVRGGAGGDTARGGDDTDFVFVLDSTRGNDVADGGLGAHDGCSVDVALGTEPGDDFTDGCEDVVGAAAVVHR
jgi:Ca2+-binding RTX toxin-like protein